MKLATTIADYKNYTVSWADAIAQYEGTGFRYLDFDFYSSIYPGSPFLTDDWMKYVEDAANAAAKYGFTFVQAHSPCYNPHDPTQNHEIGRLALERSVKACGYLGIPNLVMHSGFSPEYRYPVDKYAHFHAARKYHESLYPLMDECNVNILIENIDQWNMDGKYYFLTGEDMSDFLAFCNHPRLHACWDVGHANINQLDQYEQITRLGSQLYGVHIQDNFGTQDDHIAPFMGVLDLDAVMQGLLSANYKGYLTFEALNMLSWGENVIHPRLKCTSVTERRLSHPSLRVRKKSVELLYEIGRYILEQYNCFEE